MSAKKKLKLRNKRILETNERLIRNNRMTFETRVKTSAQFAFSCLLDSEKEKRQVTPRQSAGDGKEFFHGFKVTNYNDESEVYYFMRKRDYEHFKRLNPNKVFEIEKGRFTVDKLQILSEYKKTRISSMEKPRIRKTLFDMC